MVSEAAALGHAARVLRLIAGGQDASVRHRVREGFIDHDAHEFTPIETERYIDALYTSGFFDLVSYSLQQQQGHQYKLLVHVREKPYSPHFLKTTLGFS